MVTRREFLRRYLLYTLGGIALASCAPREAATPAAPTGVPTSVPTLAPTSTHIPTVSSAGAPTAAATNTLAPATATRVPPSPTPGAAYLAVARGTDPAAITRAAVDALGGINHFVKKGDDVIVKPNICISYHTPEYASTTNPDVVATLVALCLEAGAARVRVMDLPFSGTAAEAYKRSGIRDAVERAGGQMEIMATAKYAEVEFPSNARSLKKWKVYQDVLKANVLINVPIAKTHSVSGLTLGMKNLMGVVLNRAAMHTSLDQGIADLSTLIKPTLNLVDGVRVLTRNGPEGGSLDWVKPANTVIASTDIVAADAYAAQLFFQKTPEQVGHIRVASRMKLGRTDFDNLDIREVTL
jgi:uncharacterized protein (DUF362 family)